MEGLACFAMNQPTGGQRTMRASAALQSHLSGRFLPLPCPHVPSTPMLTDFGGLHGHGLTACGCAWERKRCARKRNALPIVPHRNALAPCRQANGPTERGADTVLFPPVPRKKKR
ncbi:hypothetical protein MRX96_008286 [Rhipicephalus microplus]